MHRSTPHPPGLLSKISDVLSKPDTVVVVGSGISAWAGLPSWTGVVTSLAEFVDSTGGEGWLVRREIQNGDLLQAASFALDQLTPRQFGEFLRGAFSPRTALPHEIHRRVVSLGPSCYISFNFDHLLEMALMKWRHQSTFRVVGNMQPIDVADIVPARATHFVFKPHGDVDSTESIILSREQYRELASQRNYVLHTLEMLFATRPIVLLGFGLRDPDFFRVKDVLAAIYKGGAGEHYAVMPDMASQELAYWRRQYGIHILSYPTSSAPDGSRDHSALVSILDDLIASTPSTTTVHVPLQPFDLARHGARLAKQRPPVPSRLLPLVVSSAVSVGESMKWEEIRYDGAAVNDLLKSYPGHLILCGPPGSGKTFAVRHFAAALGEELQEACLLQTAEAGTSSIPMYADLKFYDGDIEALLETTLPHGMSLAAIRDSGRAVFILDAANEMPSKHIESGRWLSDLVAFIDAAGRSRIVVTTRDADWMGELSIPIFNISALNHDFVRSELTSLGFVPAQLSNAELIRTLAKPLIFTLATSGAISPGELRSPRQVYLSFFRIAQNKVGILSDSEDILCAALSSLAFSTLSKGIEYFSRDDARRALARHLPDGALNGRSADDVLNALVVENIVVATSAARLTFYHQSLTEFLAGFELALRFAGSKNVLEECFREMRWDQAIFHALGFLDAGAREEFLATALMTDVVFVTKAVFFVQEGADVILSRLLDHLLEKSFLTSGISTHLGFQLQRLPFGREHLAQLERLRKQGNIIGGGAAAAVVELIDDRRGLLQDLVDNRKDYNYCQALSRALVPHVKACWLEELLRQIDTLGDQDECEALITAVAMLFESVADEDHVAFLARWQEFGRDALTILVNSLSNKDREYAREYLREFIHAGANKAVIALYMNLKFHCADPETGTPAFDPGLLSKLRANVSSGEHDNSLWAAELLRQLCEHRVSWRSELLLIMEQAGPCERAVWLYCACGSGEDVKAALQACFAANLEACEDGSIEALGAIEFAWSEAPDLVLQALRRKNLRLAAAVLGSVRDPVGSQRGWRIPIEPIREWLEWMVDLFERTGLDEAEHQRRWWTAYLLGEFIADHGDESTKAAVLDEFDAGDDRIRRMMAALVLPRMGVTTAELSEEARDWFIAALAKPIPTFGGEPPLASLATEKFLEERVLPLCDPETAGPKLAKNAQKVLDSGGRRFGRRFLVG